MMEEAGREAVHSTRTVISLHRSYGPGTGCSGRV